MIESFFIGNFCIGFPLMADKCIQDFLQHKVDKGAAIANIRTLVDSIIIGLLVSIDHVLNR